MSAAISFEQRIDLLSLMIQERLKTTDWAIQLCDGVVVLFYKYLPLVNIATEGHNNKTLVSYVLSVIQTYKDFRQEIASELSEKLKGL